MREIHKKFILNWLGSDMPEAPLLLSGSDKTVLREAVTKIIQQCVCDQAKDAPCLKCNQCQLAKEGDHPAVVTVDSQGKSIKIEEIRRVISELAHTTYLPKRVVVIHEAENLTLPAANSLLKCLEEATKKNRFILSAKSPMSLLPTIRSRCLLMKLSANLGAGAEIGGEEQVMDRVFQDLKKKLEENGPSEEVKRGYLRLRDYFLIKHAGGNVKLAKDVLRVSLPDDINKI